MGVQILNKDVSVISSILSKPKANISNVGGVGGWAGGGPASQGPLVPATAVDLFDSDVSWNFVTNIQNNTNNATHTYAVIITSQQPSTIYVNDFGFSIPTSATINGITVQINRYSDDSGMQDNNVFLVDNTETPVGDNKSNPEEFWPIAQNLPITYGGSSDLWGTTWTPTIINSDKFGLHLKGYWTGYTKFNFNIYVAWIKITVDYTT